MKRKNSSRRKNLKIMVAAVCLAGFVIQTWMFLVIYWTYPTVLDIQESMPLEIDVPGISFCNGNGLMPGFICQSGGVCLYAHFLYFMKVCLIFPEVCIDEKFPHDISIVSIDKYMRDFDFNITMLDNLRKPVKNFFQCTVVHGNNKTECSVDDITIGSHYSDMYTINFCYTINSLWGKPEKKIKKIGKYDKIVLDFLIDLSDRKYPENEDIPRQPKYTYPSNPAIQLVVHSPYTTLSAYAFGTEFLAGHNYRISLKEERKHLLPYPYQTNCTDYMTDWTKNGRAGPLNPIMVLEECKYKLALELYGCVPFSIDYPHNETVCRYCQNCTDMSEIADNCSRLLNNFNQPCNFITYDMRIQEMHVYEKKPFKNLNTNQTEAFIFASKGYQCNEKTSWTLKCQKLKIEITFDDFELSSFTYKPKYESLELFSIIGSYMGVYLGISIVAIYDLLQLGLTGLSSLLMQKRKKFRRERIRKMKVFALKR